MFPAHTDAQKSAVRTPKEKEKLKLGNTRRFSNLSREFAWGRLNAESFEASRRPSLHSGSEGRVEVSVITPRFVSQRVLHYLDLIDGSWGSHIEPHRYL